MPHGTAGGLSLLLLQYSKYSTILYNTCRSVVIFRPIRVIITITIDDLSGLHAYDIYLSSIHTYIIMVVAIGVLLRKSDFFPVHIILCVYYNLIYMYNDAYVTYRHLPDCPTRYMDGNHTYCIQYIH